MDRCERARSFMVEWLSGALGAEEARDLGRHVASCAACATEAAALSRAWAALDVAPRTEVPPATLRDGVLSAVAGARVREAEARPSWRSALKFLVPATAAALASIALLVVPDPGCHTPLAVACCGTLWAGVYALAFAVLVGSQRRSPSRALVGRGLVAAAGGLLLVRFCPSEGAATAGFAIPLLGEIAGRAATSPGTAFALGLVIAAIPLALAVLFIPPRAARPTVRGELATAGITFALLAPALYLASGFLALGALLALLGGAAVGASAPVLAEIPLRRQLAGWA